MSASKESADQVALGPLCAVDDIAPTVLRRNRLERVDAAVAAEVDHE